MPRGWMKHQERNVGKKASRGGSSAQKKGFHTSSSPGNYSSKNVRKVVLPNSFHDDGCDFELDDWAQEYVDGYDDDCSQSKKETMVEEECPICCEVTQLVPLLRNCKHPPACRSCLREMYINQAQENVSNYPLRCFHPSCNLLVRDTQLIKHQLVQSKAELKRHYRLNTLQKAYINPNISSIVHCPNCDCPKAVKKQSYVNCMNCKTKFAIVHENESNIHSTFAALDMLKRDQVGGNNGWANCPKCGMIVSKGAGCDHMRCVCGKHFSWQDAKQKSTARWSKIRSIEFVTAVSKRRR